jgi:hypothetical protein
MNDQDIFDINLNFLMKTREFCLAGEEHKAQFLLGVPQEVSSVLQRLSFTQIRELAATNMLCYTWRISPHVIKDVLSLGAEESLPEDIRWQIIASATRHATKP